MKNSHKPPEHFESTFWPVLAGIWLPLTIAGLADALVDPRPYHIPMLAGISPLIGVAIITSVLSSLFGLLITALVYIRLWRPPHLPLCFRKSFLTTLFATTGTISIGLVITTLHQWDRVGVGYLVFVFLVCICSVEAIARVSPIRSNVTGD